MREKPGVHKLIVGNKIWDSSRIKADGKMRMELTDLVRFKGHWYCGFREGFIHHTHWSGRGRIIRSADGRKWDSVFLKEWDSADVREVKLSVTSEGVLMANTSIGFVSKEPREGGGSFAPSIYDRPIPGGGKYGKYYQLDNPGTPENDIEKDVARQSVTWLSTDGLNWSSAYACPSGVNNWRWAVTWHNGMGYSVGYGGKDQKGVLYRTRDGKSWRVLRANLFPGGGNEASLAFGADNTAYCILRDARKRKLPDSMQNAVRKDDGHQTSEGNLSKALLGGSVPMFGIGKAPCYQDWEWKDLEVDWEGEGNFKSVDEVLRAPFGGPQLLRLQDGRFVAVGRNLGPGRDDGHITLFWFDPVKSRLTMVAEMAGATYGAAVEHDGKLYVSYAGQDKPGYLGVFLAKIKIPGST